MAKGERSKPKSAGVTTEADELSRRNSHQKSRTLSAATGSRPESQQPVLQQPISYQPASQEPSLRKPSSKQPTAQRPTPQQAASQVTTKTKKTRKVKDDTQHTRAQKASEAAGTLLGSSPLKHKSTRSQRPSQIQHQDDTSPDELSTAAESVGASTTHK